MSSSRTAAECSARMQNAVTALPGNSPFHGVCYCEGLYRRVYVRVRAKNCARNSYTLGILFDALLDKRVPFAFLRTAHELAHFSPAHVARRLVVFKLRAPRTEL